MKNGFSLLELIFAIVVIGIVASFAVPKFLDTRDSALVSTIKRDISAVTTSIQSYHVLHQKIDNITDAIIINNSSWEVESQKMTFKDSGNDCVVIEIKTEDSVKKLNITVSKDAGNICTKLDTEGIKTISYDLY